jgi:hypothetical protein
MSTTVFTVISIIIGILILIGLYTLIKCKRSYDNYLNQIKRFNEVCLFRDELILNGYVKSYDELPSIDIMVSSDIPLEDTLWISKVTESG